MRVLHVFAVGLWLAAATVAVRTQAPQFKTGVETILVDVQVVDAQGRPLENLGASDFDVRLDRTSRAISSVRSSASNSHRRGRRFQLPASPGRMPTADSVPATICCAVDEASSSSRRGGRDSRRRIRRDTSRPTIAGPVHVSDVSGACFRSRPIIARSRRWIASSAISIRR
jgi:hypothetical protein